MGKIDEMCVVKWVASEADSQKRSGKQHQLVLFPTYGIDRKGVLCLFAVHLLIDDFIEDC